MTVRVCANWPRCKGLTHRVLCAECERVKRGAMVNHPNTRH